MSHDVSTERMRQIVEFSNRFGAAETCKQFSISENTHGRYCRDYSKITGTAGQPRASKQAKAPPDSPDSRRMEIDKKDNTCTVTVRSADIKTLDALVKYSQVDLEIWEVERHIANSWEVTIGADKTKTGRPETFTNFQIKAWFRRRQAQSIDTVRADFIRDAKKHAPKYKPVTYKTKTTGNMLEISIPDMHIGQLSWGKETGEDYDVATARALYLDAFYYLLDEGRRFNVDHIVIPVGNDFFNVASEDLTTVHGTPQQEDGRVIRTYTIAREMLVSAIDHARQVAPVTIIPVYGNHGGERIYYLADSLYAWYHHCKNVKVITDPKPIKYFVYGKNLVGYTHGDDIKISDLPLTMAAEVPELWGKTVYREVHIGHFHAERMVEMQKVRVRVIPSLVARSDWTARKGYNHIREAQGFITNKDSGVMATFSYHPKGGQ